MTGQPFANIHNFTDDSSGLLDDDGDPLRGWYFQLMQTDKVTLTSLMGPYIDSKECEKAAMQEWDRV